MCLVAFKSNTNLTFSQTSNTSSTMYCTLLCLALLPYMSSLSIGKYPSNNLLMFFKILFMFDFLFCMFVFICVFCVLVLFCALFFRVYSCLFPTFLQFYRPKPLGGNPIAVNSIISYRITNSLTLGDYCPFS